MEIETKNAIYIGAEGREALYDLSIPQTFNGNMILFIHGYMGFKDWGCWDKVANYFLSKGYGYAKFNISHNGTTINDHLNFIDEEAFAQNSYFKELMDIRAMIDLTIEKIPRLDQLILIGHSRGGGMALIAGLDPRVSKIVSWAGISSIERRFPVGDDLLKWKKEGVKYVHNSRTNQELPLSFLQYEEFIAHKDELSIEKSCQELKKPVALFHGTMDVSVPISEGNELSSLLNVPLNIIEGADHTFKSSHPWNNSMLPATLLELCQKTDAFIQLTASK